MPSSASRPSRRNSAPAACGSCHSSTPRWTGRGRNISAACSAATADYVRKHPIATRRVMRAILKATDLCAREPARVAQDDLSTSGPHRDGTITQRQALSELPYYKWRDYDAEDTIRFYALRLYEAGLIKSSPQKIIAEQHRLALLERAQTRAEGVREYRDFNANDADPAPLSDQTRADGNERRRSATGARLPAVVVPA